MKTGQIGFPMSMNKLFGATYFPVCLTQNETAIKYLGALFFSGKLIFRWNFGILIFWL